MFNIKQKRSYRFCDCLCCDTRSLGLRRRHIPQRIRARFRGKDDAKRIDHINCQQDSGEAKSLKDGSYHVGMLHAPFKVELTLTVVKDGYETFVKHSSTLATTYL